LRHRRGWGETLVATSRFPNSPRLQPAQRSPCHLHSLAGVCILRNRDTGTTKDVITIVMSAVINADPQQVWNALTTPRELVAWDERIVDSVDVPESYPAPGQHARWRYKLGSIQVIMHDRPREIVPLERLRSSLRLGSMRFEQTYTLRSEPGEPSRTRLGMKLVAENSVPVVGAVVDRFEIRRLATDQIDTTLRSVQKWCENDH
jgi:hypothetical protein